MPRPGAGDCYPAKLGAGWRYPRQCLDDPAGAGGGRRKFILADTPGHEQYTRNMATGASTADVAILLVDARHGVRAQSRRHARIARLLGHQRLRARGQQDGPGRLRSRRLRRHRATTSRRCCAAPVCTPIPMSALHGDNVITQQRPDAVVRRRAAARVSSRRSRWTASLTAKPFRFPVQLVSGRITTSAATPARSCSGTVRVGDAVTVCRRAARPASSASSPGTAISRSAHAPMSVTLTLDDEIDISRGDVLATGEHRRRPAVRRRRRVDGRAAARSGARLPAQARDADGDAEVDHGAGAQSDRRR